MIRLELFFVKVTTPENLVINKLPAPAGQMNTGKLKGKIKRKRNEKDEET